MIELTLEQAKLALEIITEAACSDGEIAEISESLLNALSEQIEEQS